MTADQSIEKPEFNALGHHLHDEANGANEDFLTVFIAGEMFGIPVLQVQDVLGTHNVTKIPLAPTEIAGSLNLRGRVVTAIDVRKSLDLEQKGEQSKKMSVVVELDGELYSLIIDRVGDVLTLSKDDFENNPATLDKVWKDISLGVYRLKDSLMIILDVPKLIGNVGS